MNDGFFSKLVTAGFVSIFLFAVVFTVLDARRSWPGLPEGFGQGLDLVAGFLFVVAVAVGIQSSFGRGRG